eukprot:5838874-Ditylum_brightwellii.AAC.1
MQGYGNEEGKEGEKGKDPDDNEDSVVVDDDSHIKDGVHGFKLMYQVENGKVKDWNKVKRNVRECAEME